MENQKGAALVVVLSMLTMSLMLGLSGMQSSLIDERLAGNYKAASEAQMGAERAASAGWGEEPEPGDFKPVSYSVDAIRVIGWKEFQDDSNFDGEEIRGNACSGSVECYYRYVDIDGEHYIVAMGVIDDGGVAESEPLVVWLNPMSEGYNGPNFEDFDPLTILGSVSGYSHTNSRPFTISRRTNPGEETYNEGYSISVQNPDDLSNVTFFHTNEGNHAGVDGELTRSVSYNNEDLYDISGLSSFAKSSSLDNVKYFDGGCALREDADEEEGGMPSCYGPGESPGGLLVVDGDFSWNGSNYFEGLILVRGESITYNGGGGGSLVGAMVHLPKSSSGEQNADDFSLGDSNITMNGGGASAFVHDREVLSELQNSLFGTGGSDNESSSGGGSISYQIGSWE
ncbi:pilus assembly PilX family protein [Halomonas sp. BC04]|uniref:pilus assembly PilX family protein n=1 Tax=Halomonas sp. BC04 TaxID=1403540 RepID=UPI0004B0DB6E|nr:pilus assembly PilX N-terminal domain-containing protein [Halomonas sp. BC04]